jgi:hypothetical protein
MNARAWLRPPRWLGRFGRWALAAWLVWNVAEFVILWPAIKAAWSLCFAAWGRVV